MFHYGFGKFKTDNAAPKQQLKIYQPLKLVARSSRLLAYSADTLIQKERKMTSNSHSAALLSGVILRSKKLEAQRKESGPTT
jgi:hypothetical protein